MKKLNPTIRIIFLSLCFGLFFWVLDAILQYFFFHALLREMIFTPPNSFLESLLTQIPVHSLTNRIYVIVVSLLGGGTLAFYINLRNKVQEELQKSEERYHLLTENARDIIYRMSLPDGHYEYVSPAVNDIWGYSPTELYDSPLLIHKIIHPDSQKYSGEQWISLNAGDMPPSYEYQIIHKSGETRWMHQRNVMIKDTNGQPIAIEGIITDITERIKAQEELRQYTHQLEVLREASLSLTSNLSLQVVLDVLLESVMQLVSADDAHIFLYDGKELLFGAMRWQDDRQPVPFANPRQNGLTYRVARSGETIIVTDMSQSPIYKDWPLEGAIVSLPLLHNEQVVGVMNVASNTVREFSESELRILHLLADQAAIAINNARLYEEVQQHVRQLETLNTVTTALSTTLDLDKVLELIFDQVGQVLPFDSGAVFLCEEDGLRVVMDHGFTPSVKGRIFSVEENELFKEIQRTKIPLILNNVKDDARFQNFGKSKSIASWMGAPLIVRDTMIGHLTLDSNQINAFSSEQANLVQPFASQAAQAIENARLYKRVIEDANQLEKHIQERTAELRESNEGLESFAYSISHDLRAPLRAIHGFTQILLDEHASELTEEAKHYMNLLSHSATNMSNLVDGLLDFSRKSLQPLKTETVNLTHIAEKVLADLSEENQARDIDFQLSPLPSCEGDTLLLRQVFYNLIQNALKFTRNQEKAIIEIKSFQKDGFPVYYIKDNGVGFDMQYANKLFGVFQRAHLQSEFEGTGVGLAIVQKIIRRHGGEIWFEAQPQCGATFYFTVNNRLRSSNE